MTDKQILIKQIEAEKQLGKVFSFSQDGKLIWSSVGIQKYNGVYKVYIDEIEETKMNEEEYIREEIKRFGNVDEALTFIDEQTQVNSLELKTCKGQRIFNPKFD